MKQRVDVWQDTLALMVLKTLVVLRPQHGYGIARRVEQTSENVLSVNHGAIASQRRLSNDNRKAKFYSITKTGRTLLEVEQRNWQQATAGLGRFFALGESQ